MQTRTVFSNRYFNRRGHVDSIHIIITRHIICITIILNYDIKQTERDDDIIVCYIYSKTP